MAIMNVEVYLWHGEGTWHDRLTLFRTSYVIKQRDRSGFERAREETDRFIAGYLAEHPEDTGRLKLREHNEYVDDLLDRSSWKTLEQVEQERLEAERAAAPPEPGLFDDWDDYTRLLEQVLAHADFLVNTDMQVSEEIREQVRESLTATVAEAKAHRLYPLYEQTDDSR